MKKNFTAALIILSSIVMSSCTENRASETRVDAKEKSKDTKAQVPIKTDGPVLGMIETDQYIMKLHRAFHYNPAGNKIPASTRPKAGYKFIYLDVSLKNKDEKTLDGGFLFIGLKITDENNKEYRKPVAALAIYKTENPDENDDKEYKAMWGKLQPGEFHRALIYAVEVPESLHDLILSMPVKERARDFKQIRFSL